MDKTEPAAEPFSIFMQRALHDPQKGYYSRRIATIGRGGDFSTAVTISAIPGAAIAGWLAGESRRFPRVRTIIEIGGGTGRLMNSVRSSLGWWRRRRFEFRMVETSPVLRSQQAALLGGSVAWHDDLRDALENCGGRAFIYHNELLDALPMDLVQWCRVEADWKQVWLAPGRGGELVECLRPLNMPEEQRRNFSVLRAWNSSCPPPYLDQRCELQSGVRNWLRAWAPLWAEGSMLAMDYGAEFAQLYQRRPRGTLRAYLQHQRMEGGMVYANVGRQDITADVNFTDYRLWCAESGWQEMFFEPQHLFIRRNAPRAIDAAGAAGRFLIDPDGAGSAFKCVGHRRMAP